MIQTTYTNARAHFAKLFDEVSHNQEIVVINRRGKDDIALISAAELNSLVETAHLLRSPENAKRLTDALVRAKSDEVQTTDLMDLRKELGFEE